MEYMGNAWMPLISMALLLGFRHGFDLDHLATIDSITRTVRDNRYLSKMAGLLFSLGHGIVVTSISLIIGSGVLQARIPLWLNDFGNWISILFLFAFGMLTLWNVLRNSSKPTTSSSVAIFVSHLFKNKKYKPVLIVLVGAIFAFSFDTFSQVTLFSISASALSGWAFSGMLGVVFMLGMLTSDGINGLLVSSLLQQADTKSFIISQALGLVIAFFSLVIGVVNLFKILQ